MHRRYLLLMRRRLPGLLLLLIWVVGGVVELESRVNWNLLLWRVQLRVHALVELLRRHLWGILGRGHLMMLRHIVLVIVL